jgi:hypothetical protein
MVCWVAVGLLQSLIEGREGGGMEKKLLTFVHG